MKGLKNKSKRISEEKSVSGHTIFDIYDVVLFMISVAQVIFIPFVKVEERFHFMAVYDLLNLDSSSEWHHLGFKPVSRTMVGSLFVYMILIPLKVLMNVVKWGLFDFPDYVENSIYSYASRIVLSLLFCLSISFFRRSIKNSIYNRNRSGESLDKWFLLTLASQFHLVYYSSRPLGNTFALITSIFGLSYWINQKYLSMAICATSSAILFRFEYITLWFSIMCFEQFYIKRNKLKYIIFTILASSFFFILVTTLVDSYFYKRLVWPEFDSFYFNVVENKSIQYGVLPYNWYFFKALPKALCTTAVWLVLSLFFYPKAFLRLFSPILVFINIFSIFPHKEVRFIFPSLIIINFLASKSVDKLWNMQKSKLKPLIRMVIIASFALNFFVTGVSLYVSYWNYPGGHALAKLHQIVDKKDDVYLYVDIYSRMTGATPFGNVHKNWHYCLDEDVDVAEYSRFTHIIAESNMIIKNHNIAADNKGHFTIGNSTFSMVHQVLGFKEVDTSLPDITRMIGDSLMHPLALLRSLRFRIVLEPQIFILENQTFN